MASGASHAGKIFALVDCNNFFVSCERIFRPDLEGKPVVVLSSNDGCVVARSNEAKVLGIPMGAPAFQYRQLFQQQRVVCFSANFELYADISRRITSILCKVAPHTEIYSIDESFLDLGELVIPNYATWGRAVRRDVLRRIGVPVSIGIAPTKTLAKAAADYAKKYPVHHGTLDLMSISSAQRELYLAQFPLEDVWGVGRRLGPKLRAEGLSSALDLSRLQLRQARQLMGLNGLRTVLELRGVACQPLTMAAKPPQTIMRGRTFGRDACDLTTLEAAFASLTARAARQAREDGQLARKACLFLSTSKHKPGYQSWFDEVDFPMPTADTGYITAAVVKRLEQLYQPHQAYHRAVITLCEFAPATQLQIDLLGTVQADTYDASRSRMAAIDALNQRYGRKCIYYAAEELAASWQPKHDRRSRRYVTNWQELPDAFIA